MVQPSYTLSAQNQPLASLCACLVFFFVTLTVGLVVLIMNSFCINKMVALKFLPHSKSEGHLHCSSTQWYGEQGVKDTYTVLQPSGMVNKE